MYMLIERKVPASYPFTLASSLSFHRPVRKYTKIDQRASQATTGVETCNLHLCFTH